MWFELGPHLPILAYLAGFFVYETVSAVAGAIHVKRLSRAEEKRRLAKAARAGRTSGPGLRYRHESDQESLELLRPGVIDWRAEREKLQRRLERTQEALGYRPGGYVAKNGGHTARIQALQDLGRTRPPPPPNGLFGFRCDCGARMEAVAVGHLGVAGPSRYTPGDYVDRCTCPTCVTCDAKLVEKRCPSMDCPLYDVLYPIP